MCLPGCARVSGSKCHLSVQYANRNACATHSMRKGICSTVSNCGGASSLHPLNGTVGHCQVPRFFARGAGGRPAPLLNEAV